MPVIESQIDPRSEEFQTNAKQLRGLVDDLRTQLAQAALGGGDKARAKHTERGKLLARERIRALLDPARHSSNSPRSPRTPCTTAPRRAQA